VERLNGTCTDRTPFEERPAMFAELFDQVRQNAERMRLLANERPFVLQTVAVGGFFETATTTSSEPP
jgi:hypothetical protein